MTPDAARLRAARGWAHLSQRALADKLGVEEQWVKRREAGKQNLEERDRMAIAAVCDVPIDFMVHGLAGIDYTSETRDERIERVLRVHDRDMKRAIADAAESQGAVFSVARTLAENGAKLDRLLEFVDGVNAQRLLALLQEGVSRQVDRRADSTRSGDRGQGDIRG